MSYGALTLVRAFTRRVKMSGRWTAIAAFQCACGTTLTLAATTKLRDCGCGVYTAPPREMHGGSRMALYSLWRSMLARCDDPTRYGAKGVTVCDRWRESFGAFLEDVGPRPFDGASLDRLDNAKGYEPGNVRWATPTEQNRNKTNNRIVEAFGESRCLAEWSERFGVKASTIRKRLDELGWAAESAVSTPGEV